MQPLLPPHYRHVARRLMRRRPTGLAVLAIILLTCSFVGFSVLAGSRFMPETTQAQTRYEVVETIRPYYVGSPSGPEAAVSPLSPVFSPEVQYWGVLIKAWAVLYQIDPNLIATVIQIESCGDPFVSSPAGAQGLFQVMPFHFTSGEDMLEIQTNARRGLDYLSGSLERSDGHAGLALAGYNGGHGVIARGWAGWTSETQRYYYWGSRIYAEAIAGMESSPTLQEWMDRGGSSLCARAANSQSTLQ